MHNKDTTLPTHTVATHTDTTASAAPHRPALSDCIPDPNSPHCTRASSSSTYDTHSNERVGGQAAVQPFAAILGTADTALLSLPLPQPLPSTPISHNHCSHHYCTHHACRPSPGGTALRTEAMPSRSRRSIAKLDQSRRRGGALDRSKGDRRGSTVAAFTWQHHASDSDGHWLGIRVM